MGGSICCTRVAEGSVMKGQKQHKAKKDDSLTLAVSGLCQFMVSEKLPEEERSTLVDAINKVLGSELIMNDLSNAEKMANAIDEKYPDKKQDQLGNFLTALRSAMGKDYPLTLYERERTVNHTLTFMNNNPNNGNNVNSGMVHMIGTGLETDPVSVGGKRNAFDNKSKPIDKHTLLPEASIGKVRYAGLGYILQQEKILNMEDNAKKLFEEPEFAKFLDRKYGEKREGFAENRKNGESFGVGMQKEILKSFTGGSEESTLANLASHHAGVGDLTRDQMVIFKKEGIDKRSYDFPDLLTQPEGHVVPRDENGKPHAQGDSETLDKDLSKAEFGKHQYSNLGYMMFAEAMEYCFDKKVGEKKVEPLEKEGMATYKDLMNTYMLHPTRGRAQYTLDFKKTKFPEEIDKERDNVVTVNYLDPRNNETLIHANDFNGANAAGGIFTSVSDSAKFFSEFFKGFPGTPEYGQDVNLFFSPKTIGEMMNEVRNHPVANEKELEEDKNKNPRYQGPGFTVEFEKEGFDTKDWKNCKITQYDKGGDTYGCMSNMAFKPQENVVNISMITQENLTGICAKGLDMHPKELIKAYNGDRESLRQDYEKVIKLNVELSQLQEKHKLNFVIENTNETPGNLKTNPTPNVNVDNIKTQDL